MIFESGNGCGSPCAPSPGPGGRGTPAARSPNTFNREPRRAVLYASPSRLACVAKDYRFSRFLFGEGHAPFIPFAACVENAAIIQRLVNGVEDNGRNGFFLKE